MIQPLAESVSKTWPTFVWRGVLALILAAVVFVYPVSTDVVLTYLFGAFILVSGLAMLAAGFGFSSLRGPWLALVLFGLVSAVVGIGILAQPVIGALTLAYTIAFWAIAVGVFELFGAIEARSVVPNTWIWGLLGVLSIVAGMFIAYAPGRGLVVLSYTIGFYATFAGIVSIAFGIKLRGLAGKVQTAVSSARAGI